MTNSFALNHDKSLLSYFFCVEKHLANYDFLKDIESTVDECQNNSADPDQMPCSAGSDLGVHSLLRPLCPKS